MTTSVTGFDLWHTTMAEGEVSRRSATGGAGLSATLSELVRQARLDIRNRGALIVQYKDNEPPWLWHMLAAVKPLLGLEPNWDSYGAAVIDPTIVAHGLNFLAKILQSDTQPASVVPTADGGIQFEWHVSGVDLEIAFGRNGRVEVGFHDLASGEEWFGEGPDVYDGLDRLRKAVMRL